MNSGQGLRTGEVFTINPGELVFFECHADSNPPNSYVWISKSSNATKVIMEGPQLEVLSYQLAQAEEYLCRAFNNVTQKQDETRFTLVVASLGTGGQRAEPGGREQDVGGRRRRAISLSRQKAGLYDLLEICTLGKTTASLVPISTAHIKRYRCSCAWSGGKK